MDIKEKQLTFNQVLRNDFGKYILKYNYQFSQIRYGDEKMKDISILFSNLEINREIVFCYIPFDIRGNIEESVIVFFHKIPTGSYTEKEILLYEREVYDESKFNILNYEGNFEQQVEGVCKYLVNLFENPKLKEWIEGKKWEDIPFDWGRYK
jgi:hypothetical protein